MQLLLCVKTQCARYRSYEHVCFNPTDTGHLCQVSTWVSLQTALAEHLARHGGEALPTVDNLGGDVSVLTRRLAVLRGLQASAGSRVPLDPYPASPIAAEELAGGLIAIHPSRKQVIIVPSLPDAPPHPCSPLTAPSLARAFSA